MSTRSRIIVANPKGDFTSIYCHYDGYPAGVGKTLLQHYRAKSKVRKLLSLGDLSSLGVRLEPLFAGHTFDTAERDCTVAYGRDRGTEGTKAVTTPTLREAVELAADCWAEYVYLFWNGHWSYQTVEDALARKPFTTLNEGNTTR